MQGDAMSSQVHSIYLAEMAEAQREADSVCCNYRFFGWCPKHGVSKSTLRRLQAENLDLKAHIQGLTEVKGQAFKAIEHLLDQASPGTKIKISDDAIEPQYQLEVAKMIQECYAPIYDRTEAFSSLMNLVPTLSWAWVNMILKPALAKVREEKDHGHH